MLATAMARRKREETRVADDAADIAVMVDVFLEAEGGGGDEEGAENDDRRVAEREHEADGDGALAFLHELAGDVVDCRDVVGVYGVAETEGVGEECGSQKDGETMKRGNGPQPCPGIDEDEQRIDADDFAADMVRTIVEEIAQSGGHRGSVPERRGRSAGLIVAVAGSIVPSPSSQSPVFQCRRAAIDPFTKVSLFS